MKSFLLRLVFWLKFSAEFFINFFLVRPIPMKPRVLKPCIAASVIFIFSGCVSNTTVTTKLPDQPAKSDALYRAQLNTEIAAEYFRLGKMAAALEAADKAIAANANYAPAYNMLGIIRVELKQDDKAQQAYERALKISPEDSETLNNLGWFICDRQEPAKGMPYFERALQNPLYATPERALLNSGVCARRMGDLVKADSQIRAALRRQPNYAQAYYEQAELRFVQGQIKEAENLLSQYNQQVQQPSVGALFLGARLARLQGDKNAEASYIQQLTRRFPDALQTKAILGERQ